MKENLTVEKMKLEDNTVVIRKFFKGIEGGRTLDTTEFTEKVIHAGHVIITDGEGTYKPMPVSECGYGNLPEGYKYCGVLYSTIDAKKPAAAIMTWGVVNPVAMPYPITSIEEAFKKACPYIDFQKDEEA